MTSSMITRLSLLTFASLTLGGCVSEDYLRIEGVTPHSGDAVAANTVLQMVDPWPAGVEDTDLLVPAERGTSSSTSAAGGDENTPDE